MKFTGHGICLLASLVPVNIVHDDQETRREIRQKARKQARVIITPVSPQDAAQGRYDALLLDSFRRTRGRVQALWGAGADTRQY